MSARILLLGIDAGHNAELERWVADGTLPTLGALVARGLVGATESLEGFFVGATWPSFATGASPAEHGVHSLVQLAPGTYELHRDLDRFLTREPFWAHLGRAGYRVAILDVPLSSVSPDLNGIQMVEWGSHDAVHGFRTWPRGLAGEVRAHFGVHPMTDSCDLDHRSPEQFVAFTRRLVEGVQRKAALTRHYLRGGEWDLFAQVFTEAHCAGHQAWHLHDSTVPGWDEDVAAFTGDPLREVYRAIDAALGEILADVGRDTLVVVLASHGMSYRVGAQFLLGELLGRLGAAPPAPLAVRPGRLETVLARGWAFTPPKLRAPVRAVRRYVEYRRGARAWPRPLPAHLTDGRCFVVDNGLVVGGIRLNLAGREPRGVLPPALVPEFRDELTAALREIVDVDVGRPLVARVLDTDRLYAGPSRHQLPDLLVEWSQERALGSATVGGGRGAVVRATSRRIGSVGGTNRYCRSGDHRRGGLFVAVGPGLAPGRLHGAVSIMDFAPTIASRLGVSLPPGAGRPIPALLVTR